MDGETQHTTKTVSVFDVWVTSDQNYHKPHYPSYPVRNWKAGSSFTLEGAERILRDYVRQTDEEERYPGCLEHLHSLRIVEIPAGVYAPEWKSLSEYLYDRRGNLIDSRPFPFDGVFTGRRDDEVRFLKGDLCEVLDGERVYLGFVVELPPSVDKASRINAGPFHLDASDDSYIVLTDSHYINHDHVDSLRIFKPMHKVSSRTKERLARAYEEFAAFPALMESRDGTAAGMLRDAAENLGWAVEIEVPRWENDTFKLVLGGVDGYPDGLDLRIPQRKAWEHMDRILATFNRLAGKITGVRGYSVKKVAPPPHLVKAMKTPEQEEEYYL